MKRGSNMDFGYEPQPKQLMFHRSWANEILYGGAAGGGKSRALRAHAFYMAVSVPDIQIYIFRREFPDLERNHIMNAQGEYPDGVCTYREAKKRFEFWNGSVIHFCHCQYEKDVFGYQGAEIHALMIDELTQYSEFMYDYLRGRVRCAIEVPEGWRHKVPGIYCFSNPGGIGHHFCKRRFVDSGPHYEIRKAPDNEGGMNRQYIPATLDDNRILMERDPEYGKRLDALPEPYRTAYKTGDWDIFMGQMFNFNFRDHVIRPCVVPADGMIWMTFDWGFGKPFSVGWWYADNDGRLIRFTEMYGCREGEPDVGLRLSDSEIADRILAHEEKHGLRGRNIMRLCGHDCFSKKPAYGQGGQAPSTAEVFAGKGLVMRKADNNRVLKIRQFHQRLMVPEGGGRPMLQVFDTCRDFIRTIPLLQADTNNPEEVDTKLEDHVFDEASQVCMARPIGKAGVNFTGGAGIDAKLGAV